MSWMLMEESGRDGPDADGREGGAGQKPKRGAPDTAEDDPGLLASDQPLQNPDNDALGHAPFARNLASSIEKMAPPEGIVVALNGPWGSGKTSILNFTREVLREQDGESPVVVEFNPWWFTGEEDLALHFFRELRAELDDRGVLSRKASKAMKTLGTFLAEVPDWRAGLIGTLLSGGDDQSVRSLKDTIGGGLEEKRRRVLVIVDDIDRLGRQQVVQLFRVIKAIGDLPGVVYLLAFDRLVVEEVLGEVEGTSGNEYLAKIVQVSFDVPPPSPDALRRMFATRINRLFGNVEDETRLANLFLDGVQGFLDQPRDVVRLVNHIQVTYPPADGEVDAIDFLGIECIRVFQPDVYEKIRKNPGAFAGNTGGPGYGDDTQLEKFHNDWLENVPDENKGQVKAIMTSLFPRLEGVWGNTHYGTDWLSTWRKDGRIASPEAFPAYFRMGLPEDQVGRQEMARLIASLEDANQFEAELRRLAEEALPTGGSRLSIALSRLQDYTKEEIPTEHVPTALYVLLDLADDLDLPQDRGAGVMRRGNALHIARLFAQLVRRLDGEARTDAVTEAFQTSRSPSTLVSLVVMLGQQHGKYTDEDPLPEDEWLVPEEVQEALESSVLETVRASAQAGTLAETPSLSAVISWWNRHGKDDEVRDWVEAQAQTDDGVARLLTGFASPVDQQQMGDRVPKRTWKLDPRWLDEYVEVDQLVPAAKRVLEDEDRPVFERRAAEAFLSDLDRLERGLDPHSIEAQLERSGVTLPDQDNDST